MKIKCAKEEGKFIKGTVVVEIFLASFVMREHDKF